MDQLLLAPPDLAQIVSCIAGYDLNALPVSRVQEVIRHFVQPLRVAECEDLRASRRAAGERRGHPLRRPSQRVRLAPAGGRRARPLLRLPVPAGRGGRGGALRRDGSVLAAGGHRRRLQAAEALKLMAAAGRSLAGRLMLIEALDMDIHTIRIARNPQCPVCASQANEVEMPSQQPSLVGCGFAASG